MLPILFKETESSTAPHDNETPNLTDRSQAIYEFVRLYGCLHFKVHLIDIPFGIELDADSTNMLSHNTPPTEIFLDNRNLGDYQIDFIKIEIKVDSHHENRQYIIIKDTTEAYSISLQQITKKGVHKYQATLLTAEHSTQLLALASHIVTSIDINPDEIRWSQMRHQKLVAAQEFLKK